VPPGDADALAAALDHMLGMTPDRLAAMGARSRAAVRARYTTTAMQDATLNVYREVMGVALSPMHHFASASGI
jgi:hypothetical protein